uniref:Uncharacterized protein n=1 Tax=Arundo donax TaxID=35708 RepID=A0A0A8XVM5_ARUDO
MMNRSVATKDHLLITQTNTIQTKTLLLLGLPPKLILAAARRVHRNGLRVSH